MIGGGREGKGTFGSFPFSVSFFSFFFPSICSSSVLVKVRERACVCVCAVYV